MDPISHGKAHQDKVRGSHPCKVRKSGAPSVVIIYARPEGWATRLTFTRDGANRLTSVTSSLSDAQHPATLYATNATRGFYPPGLVREAQFGNGLTETLAYKSRLQPCRMNLNSSAGYYSTCSDTVPSGNVLDFTVGYNLGSNDNGNIVSLAATGNQVFGRTYAYDVLNRINSMGESASGQACKNLSWTIDAWGNMTAQNKTGTCFSFSATALTNNQLTGYSYDAAGNVINDGVHSYSYDAEGRIVQVDGGTTASYIYNENGKRARKTVGGAFTEFYYGPNGSVQSEYNGSSWPVQYIYSGDRLIAEYTNSTTEFVHSDHLGSTRLVTAMNQSIVDNLDYEPFGQQASGASATTHKFTGKERDSESGLDFFGARHYASSMGRWLVPDWAAKPSAVPYAVFGNPQSLNLYSYVGNNPLMHADPDGHCWPAQSCYQAIVNAVNNFSNNVSNSSANSSPAVAALKTFGAGMLASAVSVAASPLTMGTATGTCMGGSGCSAGGAALAVGGDLLKGAAIAGGLSAAAGSLTGAAATDATVLSGHGMYDAANGITTIPSGTTFTMPTGLGNSISDAYGGAIESGANLSPFTNEMTGAQSYLSGSQAPNLTLYPPEGLNIQGGTTVSSPTNLDKLLKPDMGNVQWSACCNVNPN
jgi:RHS repeat-associated protein